MNFDFAIVERLKCNMRADLINKQAKIFKEHRLHTREKHLNPSVWEKKLASSSSFLILARLLPQLVVALSILSISISTLLASL
jgi:hypothetical protein